MVVFNISFFNSCDCFLGVHVCKALYTTILEERYYI